ncbi:DNA cytosine methyltransferase [Streptomyces sp. NBC_00513]|uniref:DNA cytosine methyltransferase n=1 Tax=unclassified Streptomyces TaxID=2593676 RepID=UPI00225234CC|nr:DNA cytosine methyltransferase [Streptomyces sp. NBC_00424]MCX5075221.1 DNA cytosine methyltransferase [Streptomyces sp. NBC_00424]WUD41647.1 DNA cytosine methyltransferase [Streptomyces sp. NBC_00513]
MTRMQPQPSRPGQIRVMDLFAGAGGFSAGFSHYTPRSGVNPFASVAAVEFDPAAASTYAANFGGAHVYPGDISDFDPTPFKGEVDVIMGGPPCQGFSGLGKQNPDDPRNELWQEYVRVVARVHPKVFVIENVDRFLRSPQFEDLRTASQTPGHPLYDYTVVPALLNAADYGVPQARRRVIVICTRKDLGETLTHPEPTHAKHGHTGEVDAPPTLPRWEPVSTVFERSAKRPLLDRMPDPRGGEPALVTGVQGHHLTTDLHFGRSPEDLSRARYKAIPENGNRKDLRGVHYRIDRSGNIRLSTEGAEYKRLKGPEFYLSTESWDNHNSGSGDVMGRLRAHTPSVTIRTEFYKPEKGRYLHPTADRPITHYEAALIQGFPEDFKWYGTKIQIARQIGNAVPVGLGTALAGAIHTFLARHM